MMLQALLLLLVPTTLVAGACTSKELDLILIMDGSGSVNKEEFKQMQEFLIKLVEDIGVSEMGTHIGLIEYSRRVSIQFELETHNTTLEVTSGIQNTPRSRSVTYTHLALDAAVGVFNRSNRPNADRLVILLTDGKSTKPELTPPAAANLKASGARIIGIGIGDGINQTEVDLISSSIEDSLSVDDFEKLNRLMHQLTATICEHCNYNDLPPTCEWKYRTLNWTCPDGQQPKVYAFWGRLDNVTCVHQVDSKYLQNVNCPGDDDDASEAVQTWCDQKASSGLCTIRASVRKLKVNGQRYDPCRGTFKYLKACVDCVDVLPDK